MAGELAILVPVLGRPHRVKPLLDSIYATTKPKPRVLFICDEDDTEEIETILADGRTGYLIHDGNYAGKINAALAATEEPLLFIGADDLEFQPGWYEAAKEKLGRAHVVGVNDLIERRRDHATHFLVTRSYASRGTIDRRPGLLHEGYTHWFCDDELIGTAKKRGAYAYAEDAHVKHLHPMAGMAEDDETYKKGRMRSRHDRKLFLRRVHLWT